MNAASPREPDKSDVLHRERKFHDEWAHSIDPARVMVFESFAGSTSPEGAWISERLGELDGLRLLELGSGAGEGAVFFARRGATVTATDLSPQMLGVVEKVAALHGVSVSTVVASAEDLSAFPDESFDIVYAANLLHHVDIARCLDEVRRVLRPGGRAAFWDPVAHNPIINVYRRMAAALRTPDEHPIRREDLDLFHTRFDGLETRFFWLTSLVVFLKFFLIDRVHPSSERYWKRILTEETDLRPWLAPLMALDRKLLRVLPFLRWWCWNVAIIVTRSRPR